MERVYKLTAPQRSIYLMEQYFPNTTMNNICGSVYIKQNVDLKLLNIAINEFIKNNDSFKIRFKQEGSELVQYFVPDEFFDFEKLDIENESEIDVAAKKEVNTRLEIVESRPFNFKLFKLKSGFGGFIINAHHMISDAATLTILITEIIKIYSKLLKNEKLKIEKHSYIDYINSEEEYIKSTRFKKDKTYWEEVLKPLPEVATFLPQNSNTIDNPGSKRAEFVLDIVLLNKIKSYCLKHNISVYNFLIGIYSIYLGKINNMEHFVIGTPVLNRTTHTERATPGMFINTSILKIDLSENMCFKDFVKNIATQTLGMLKHQKYSYQYILNDIRNQDKSVPNLYDVVLSYQTTQATDTSLDIPYIARWHGANCISDTLNVHFHDNNGTGSLIVVYDYKTSKVTRSEIKKMHKRIIEMFKQVLVNETISIYDIDIVTTAEKNQILNTFNNAPFDYTKDKDLITLFKNVVQKNPDKIALCFENKKITYKELDNLSNNLAIYLKKYNFEYEDKISIFLDKSIEMIIAILAILKINAAFVPIDVDYPESRIKYILKDASSKFVLTTTKLENKMEGLCDTICIDKLNLNKESEFKYTPKSPSSLAYVMYTSGSTGKPKGVMIEQKSILRLVKNPNFIKFSTQERILQTGSIVFDACTFEIWAALLNGFELYILKKQDLLNPTFLEKYLVQNQITTLFITTSLFNQLSDINPFMFKDVRYLLTGGDVVSTKHINQVIDACPKLKIVHCYGPTENTTFSTCFDVKKKYDYTIPIGSPISGTTCYVMSKFGSIEPVGVPGELYVGGDGISRGYLNKDALTSENFIPNQYDKTSTLYKTGDLVKWQPEGVIEFIERIDSQVKIRGFRVELSEINNAILSNQNIKDSYTIIKTINGSKEICSYIIEKQPIDIEELKTFLKQIIPSYMIPNYFTKIEKFPLTVNGKIDKAYLPTPSLNRQNKEIVAPRTAFELEILNKVKKLLPDEEISITDNFFDDLGLDSLSAMSLCSSLYKYNVSIQDISDYPSIETLASKIENHLTSSHFENILPKVDIIKNDFDYDLSNVLLTGSLGFLGSHILKELLLCDKVKKVYCLIRDKGGTDYTARFNKAINYYFQDKLDKAITKKVNLICGDFEKPYLGLSNTEYEFLTKKITTVIHCGANVKHYGNFQKFKSSNVIGTQNIIEFCRLSKAYLAHISTISVSGYKTVSQDLVLTEKDFNIGQCFNNHVYMITKYLAEYNVISAINHNLIKAKIFRMGNIMPRKEDNVFQINYKDNALFSRLQTIINLGKITSSYGKIVLDFSPVDLCAKAILTVLQNHIPEEILHIYNNNQISLIDFLKKANIKVKNVSEKEFIENLSLLKNPFASHLLNDLQNPDISITNVTNEITTSILENYGFEWNKIDADYISNLIKLI